MQTGGSFGWPEAAAIIDNQIPLFLSECVVFDDDSADGLSHMTVYGLYISWCLTGNKTPLPGQEFCNALRLHGLQSEARYGVEHYRGLRMADSISQDETVQSAASVRKYSAGEIHSDATDLRTFVTSLN
ncbi:primase-like DNA-binding domain-containing protein [Paenarthrobacter sp. NPDC056912]|uniref:primase-like DNA-binding domain-containing protein n=1 Tax=Paenarthrobacter sp. NPDC056912 TaxID=3345965 RepID=UPI00366BD9BF